VKSIDVIPLGGGVASDPGLEQLEFLAARLARAFRAPCRIRPEVLDIAPTWDNGRGQYHSTAILRLLDQVSHAGALLLGLTTCDLFVPVLTFVFGEAQVAGSCATVSMARLREEFYGLPAQEHLLRERLVKEAIHELGHTFGLQHCSNWECVMASSHGVERLDVKNADFCPRCRKAAFRGCLF
jgi:archaemetzincin